MVSVLYASQKERSSEFQFCKAVLQVLFLSGVSGQLTSVEITCRGTTNKKIKKAQ